MRDEFNPPQKLLGLLGVKVSKVSLCLLQGFVLIGSFYSSPKLSEVYIIAPISQMRRSKFEIFLPV